MQSALVWQGNAHLPYWVLQWCVPQGTSFWQAKREGTGGGHGRRGGGSAGSAGLAHGRLAGSRVGSALRREHRGTRRAAAADTDRPGAGSRDRPSPSGPCPAGGVLGPHAATSMIAEAVTTQIESVRMKGLLERLTRGDSFVEAGLDRQLGLHATVPFQTTMPGRGLQASLLAVLNRGAMRCLPAASLAAVLCAAACTHGEPPATPGLSSIAAPELPALRIGHGLPRPLLLRDLDPDPVREPRPRHPPADPRQARRLGPRVRGARRRALDAIVADNPPQAAPFFFPVAAYQQVKDIPDPASDWKHRLFAAYAHDIHALHARLAPTRPAPPSTASTCPTRAPGGSTPARSTTRIGYYRVFGTRLRYRIDGAARSFDVKSLISWRGEWFVVHLSAIK